MARNYIDFISAYCDRWCERCAFTSRCSTYAVHVATAMCGGDAEAGFELAVGRPATTAGPAPAREWPSSLFEEPSAEEMATYRRQYESRRERIDESPITTHVEIMTTLGHHWLEEHRGAAVAAGNPAVADAIEIVAWDLHLIGAKLHRALDGRDRTERGEEEFGDDHPIQNDWNGSAKVALVSIDRSIDAWKVIAEASGDSEASAVAAEVTQLRQRVEETFPDARRFIRPGFDAPRRRRRLFRND